MTDLLKPSESIWDLQLRRANAQAELMNLQGELYQTDLYKKMKDKELEVRELELQEEEMKENILNWMMEKWIKSIESLKQKFTVKQNPPSVTIIDENMIPQNFKKLQTKVVVDKTAIKKAIQAWEDVVWAELTCGYSLVITPK